MKKIILLLFVTSLFVACSGDRGPQGHQGPPGDYIVGKTFERTVNFAYEPANNLYSALINMPDNIQVYDSDAVLVYQMETVPGTNGPINTYILLPQVYFLNMGTIQYVFDYTPFDVEILLTGNFNLSTLSFDFIQNQTFRIVVVPSDFASNPNVNIQAYGNLLKSGVSMQVLN